MPPVGSKAFTEADVEPLVAELQRVETTTENKVAQARWSIEGISCIGCVWLIEAIFQRQSGSARVRIDPRSGTLETHWQRGGFDIAAFARELQKISYRLSLYSDDPNARAGSRQLANRLGLCGFFLMNTMLFTLPGYLGMAGDFFLSPLFQMLGATFATLSLIIGGGYFIQRAWQAARNHVLHIDLPIAAGLLAGYGGSLLGWATGYLDLVYFDFVATFVFLMLLGRWLQEYALEKNRSHLQRQKTGPRNVTQIEGANDGQSIPSTEVTAGMEYSLAPGDINPVAADPLDTKGSLSLEWINGEANPIAWPQNRTAPAGAINVGLRSLRLRARENWDHSLLAQLLERPKDEFQHSRLQTILKHYIAAVLTVAAIGFTVWLTLSGDMLRATQVLISVLIVSCPCALGVALPMCDEFANARLRRCGLFIKSAQIWERMRRVRTVVFDKTGTLTMDIPRLENPESVRSLDPLATDALHHLVSQNRHPIARSLREALLATHPKLQAAPAINTVHEAIGQGVAWKDTGGNEWALGKPSWKRPANEAVAPEQKAANCVLRQNGLLVASFCFHEDVRDDAVKTIEHFRNLNLDTVILSGDATQRVQSIAEQLGVNSKAQCTPRDKADWIIQNATETALMIGDGANDSLAFDAAVCRGTPVVDKSILEASADFFFFGRSLRSLSELFKVSTNRRRTVSLIFTIAVLYNISAVGICLAGLMHPLLAAILMPLSSVFTLGIAWWQLGRGSVQINTQFSSSTTL